MKVSLIGQHLRRDLGEREDTRRSERRSQAVGTAVQRPEAEVCEVSSHVQCHTKWQVSTEIPSLSNCHISFMWPFLTMVGYPLLSQFLYIFVCVIKADCIFSYKYY